MRARAIFLDHHRTILEDPPGNFDPKRIVLARGVAVALRDLKSRGFRVIVVSNETGAGYDEHEVATRERRIQELLTPSGTSVDAFYHCPHRPNAAQVRYAVRCLCRKPQPGLIRRAARDLGIDLAASWLIGDLLDDVEAGNRAGCRSILLCNGNETEWRDGPYRRHFRHARSLREAARLIAAALGDEAKKNADAVDAATRA